MFAKLLNFHFAMTVTAALVFLTGTLTAVVSHSATAMLCNWTGFHVVDADESDTVKLNDRRIEFEDTENRISFNRDIKPLLSDRCFLCHGPDESSRQAGFRLDDPTSAVGEADSGEPPIVAGDADASELIRRIMLDADDDERMPPAEANKQAFTEIELEKFRDWIEQGAKYEKHWAFVAPTRPDTPASLDAVKTNWGNGPIDSLALAQMLNHGLSPSKPAKRAKIIRRLTFDLTGLPPTPKEVEAFVNDDSLDAYERIVDRLLASPRYGEHMARFWLDAVRYADTHGLHFDNYREVWPYRDWVITSFNDNMPWGDFTTKQIAGDLMANSTDEDLIASGYNRLHVTTNEGGTILEEIFVRNVVDRVSTTGSVFLGLSVGCAQCHDHKFDPITSRDFYSMFAYFNSLDANVMDGNAKDHAPVIRIATAEATTQLAAIDEKLVGLNEQKAKPDAKVDAAWAIWQTEWRGRAEEMWTQLPVLSATATHGTTLAVDGGKNSVTASGVNPGKETFEIILHASETGITGLQLEALALSDESGGRAPNGNAVLSEIEADIRPADDKNAEFKPIRFISADADYAQPKFPVSSAIDRGVDDKKGWAIEGHRKRGSRIAAFATDTPFGFESGTQIRIRLKFVSRYRQHSFRSVRFSATTDQEIGVHQAQPWNLLGPFVSSDGQAAYHKDFGPETHVDLTSEYYPTGGSAESVRGEFGQTSNNNTVAVPNLSWQLNSEFADATPHTFPGQELGVRYLYREILSPCERDLTLSLGSDDAIKVFFNNELTHENNVARGVAPDQEIVPVRLREGINRLLLKIVNTGGATGFYYAEKESESLIPGVAMQSILRIATDKRTDEQYASLKEFFRRSNPEWRRLLSDIESLEMEKEAVEKGQPTTLVMKERAEPKPAFLLKRGQYDQPDKKIGPLPRAVPGFLPPLPDSAPQNRLGFAQWLLTPEHPLTARVAVNRFWQQFLGKGIVATADDFGSQGTQPTHPKLLDWLAVEFRESNWDVKSLVKQIVMSATYRQDSAISPSAHRADATNRWLARGPRYRLDAEMLRDQALAVSGLLVNRLGGPAVKPPQPAGLWKAVGYVGANTSLYTADKEASKVHRRSIYTFWKRTSPPPEMTIFDSPTREECVVSRERTNNPLQALLLLNDPQYFEAARHLAERAIRETGGQAKLNPVWRMFELATNRKPATDEMTVLIDVYVAQLAVFRKDEQAARDLVSVGAFPVPESVVVSELAALTVLGNIILNLDEVISKQ